ncbi:MAG: hypothetical protein PHT02_00040 [Tissierellia bacterium]|nr:hypothetical protein [Tissierellia bacterium]
MDINTDNRPITFNKKGLLLLKNYQDRLEYHFYDRKIPESIDINDILESYYDSHEEIYILIATEYKMVINETGILHKNKIAGITTYFINDINIELLLFELTDQIIQIQIKRIINEAEEGDKIKDESDRYEENNKS